MFLDNIKTALYSIKSSRWRSLLTMLGVIIGVVSVITTLSLGEGVKKQIISQINQLGSDLIIIRSGTLTRDSSGEIENIDIFSSIGSSTLTAKDLSVVQMHPDIQASAPLALVGGLVTRTTETYIQARVVATSEQLPEIFSQPVEYGGFFRSSDKNKQTAVIGSLVAEKLFGERVPIGKSLSIRGQDFVVVGVFGALPSSPFSGGMDYNSVVFIPFNTAQTLTNNTLQIMQILAKPKDVTNIKSTIKSLDSALFSSHSNQRDFVVLEQEETLAIVDSVLSLVTAFIAGVASISLIVGGIGIMNIMLVSVSERTHEIGIRKSVGATNSQIWSQFLIEATVLSAWGGVVGMALSGIVNLLIRLLSDLRPVITFEFVGIAVGVSVIIGIVFGIAPAVKASRKDPIEALREW